MSVIQKQITLLTTEENANAVAGSAFEFARSDRLVSIGVTADTTGGFITIQSGSDIVLEESQPVVKATPPVIPDEMYYNDASAQGERLVIRLRNPSAGTIVFFVIVQITLL